MDMATGPDKNRQVEALFRRYGPLVYRRALKILGEPSQAEDATQEIFIRVVNGLETFDGRSKLSTWLFQITTNHCLNQIRNRSRRRELWRDEVVPQAQQKGGEAHNAQSVLLRQLLGQAEPELAEAAVCVFLEGMTGAEAASALNVSRRTVINRVERFKAWAKSFLTQDQEPRPPPDTS